MKAVKFILIMFMITELSFSQDMNVSPSGPFFLNSNIRSNITSASKVGFGLRVSAGYRISDNFSALLSSGYMTSYDDPKQNVIERTLVSGDYIVTQSYSGERIFQMIPIDLSFRFKFSLLGFEPYGIVKVGYDFMFNNNDYDLTIETMNESTGEILESESGTPNSLNGAPNEGGTFNFGIGLGGGVLIPITNNLDLDISYIYSENSVSPVIHSLGVGFNFGF